MFISGCSKEDRGDILSGLPDKPTPVITSVSPSVAYGGDEAVITGSGFSVKPSENLITFGPHKAFGYKSVRPYEATATELKFKLPILSGDSTDITSDMRVSLLHDADPERSNALPFTFKLLYFTKILDEEIGWPGGIDVDADTNVYVGGRNDEVIYKIAKDGTKSVFANVATKGAMHFGPEGWLYFCNLDDDMIHRVSADGKTVEEYVSCPNPVDFDWDANGNLWIISTEYWDSPPFDMGVFVWDGTTLTKAVDIAGSGNAKSCRVFDGHLYVAGVDWDMSNGYGGYLYKYPIDGKKLGTRVDLILTMDSDDFPLGFDIDEKGTIYYAMAWQQSLFTLTQSGVKGVMYKDQLQTPSRFITFFGKAVYIVYPGGGDVGQVMMANIGIKQAPRYGRK